MCFLVISKYNSFFPVNWLFRWFQSRMVQHPRKSYLSLMFVHDGPAPQRNQKPLIFWCLREQNTFEVALLSELVSSWFRPLPTPILPQAWWCTPPLFPNVISTHYFSTSLSAYPFWKQIQSSFIFRDVLLSYSPLHIFRWACRATHMFSSLFEGLYSIPINLWTIVPFWIHDQRLNRS